MAMSFKRHPKWRQAKQLLVSIDLAVRHFPRHQEYTPGMGLHHEVERILQIRHWALKSKRSKVELVQLLEQLPEDTKVQIKHLIQIQYYFQPKRN